MRNCFLHLMAFSSISLFSVSLQAANCSENWSNADCGQQAAILDKCKDSDNINAIRSYFNSLCGGPLGEEPKTECVQINNSGREGERATGSSGGARPSSGAGTERR